MELVKQACANPSKVKILALDLEAATTLHQKVAAAITLFGGVDILVNNGGISQRAFAKDTELSVDKRILDVNYIGTVALTKALLPHFIAKKRGHFVTTTSIVGKIGTPLRSSYAASKHALHGFFDSLRAEVYEDQISVTLVCPGFVTTNVSKNALTGDGSPQQTMDKATQNGIAPAHFCTINGQGNTTEKRGNIHCWFQRETRCFCKTNVSETLVKNDSKNCRLLKKTNAVKITYNCFFHQHRLFTWF